MDSLAPVINWIKRNGFWLSSGFVAVAVLVGWYLASTQMQEAKTKSIRDYKSTFSSVRNIRNVAAVTAEDGVEEAIVAHPNADTAEKMTERLEATCDSVIAAWKMKRDRQEPLMQFPKEVLGENTYRFFTLSKPPEQVANGEVVGREGETYLRTYGEQIPKKFALIARSLKANWKFDQELIDAEARKLAKEKEEMARTGMMGMGNEMSGRNMGMGNQVDLELNKYAVIWEERNQKLWQKKLTDFQNWDDNVKSSKSPTLLQAQMLQQDIWLLEGMFNIIKSVNGSATTNDLAVIKEIHHIAFGREARAKLGEVMEPDKRLGGAKVPAIDASGGMDMMEAMSGMSASMSAAPLEEGGFDINGDESPFHGRYVNVDLEPVPALEVINVVTGEEFPETNLELIVGKRVPFRLAVKMDERKINAFLSQCANSPFEFEVMQLRVNRPMTQTGIDFNGGKEENKAATTIEGGMGNMEGMMGGMMDMDMMGPSGFQIQKLKALEPSEIETRLSYDVDVEFYGVVKLYNPVRGDYLRKAVGLPVEGSDQEEDSDGELPSVAIREP